MPTWLMKIGDDEYLEWSTVVDAPVSPIMTRGEAADAGHDEDRLQWTDQHLCSCRARLGENVEIRNDRAVATGGGRLAYHFDSYEEVHAFLLPDPEHPQGGLGEDRIFTIEALREAYRDA